MEIHKIIKKIIEYFSNILLFFCNKKVGQPPNRDKNWQMLQNIVKDHPIYSKETFIDHPVGIEVDLCLVIPFYNVTEEYLVKCMESLLKQKTEYSYRLICIDDGSQDDTLIQLKQYENKYPNKVIVYHQENGGISSARNKGIQLSNSKYIGFIDQDDWVDERYVQKLLEKAYLHNADVVKCSHIVVKDDRVRSKYLINDMKIYGEMDDRILEISGMIWSGIYKKRLFEEIRFPEKYWYEDMIARLILYRMGNCFVSICCPLYYKRKHRQNASTIIWSGKNGKCLEHLYLVKHLLEENNKLGLKSDIILNKCVIQEMGQYLMWRTRGQSKANRTKAFYEACYIINELVTNTEGLNSIEKECLESYKTFNYARWLLLSWRDWATT